MDGSIAGSLLVFGLFYSFWQEIFVVGASDNSVKPSTGNGKINHSVDFSSLENVAEALVKQTIPRILKFFKKNFKFIQEYLKLASEKAFLHKTAR